MMGLIVSPVRCRPVRNSGGFKPALSSSFRSKLGGFNRRPGPHRCLLGRGSGWAGLGRVLDNAERHSSTHCVFSSYVDVDVRFGGIRLALGAGPDVVKSVPLVAMKVGLARVL